MKLIYNAIKTPDGTILESRSEHDFKSHLDKNGKWYMVDGGLDYIRRSCNLDQIDLSLYDDEPHEVQREFLTWGTYGKDGLGPLTYKKIKDLDTPHIQTILDSIRGIKEVIAVCLTNELTYRQEKGETK